MNAAKEPMRFGKALVLVVEDEPLLRWVAMDVVEEAGLTAVPARDAEQAVAVMESEMDIRIPFTDIELHASINGIELAKLIQGRWPRTQVILTSGRNVYGTKDMPAPVQYFAKPYLPDELIATLRRLAA